MKRLVFLAMSLVGCDFGVPDISASEIPEKPVWQDVKPLLDDHCNLCHGHPSNYGAPGGFRLDRYGNGGDVRGVRANLHEVWETILEDEMPPAAAWGDGMGKNGKKLIRKWIDQGAPECRAVDDCPDTATSCTSAHTCR